MDSSQLNMSSNLPESEAYDGKSALKPVLSEIFDDMSVLKSIMRKSPHKIASDRPDVATSSKRSNILGELEDEIERQLEEKASRNELSVLNVKVLLRAVLTHDDVRKYVEFTCNKIEEPPEYQMKLTRAKAKDLIEKLPVVAPFLCLPSLPTPQKKSEINALIHAELSEDSSDEEYRPQDETIEEEDISICDSLSRNGDEFVMSPLSMRSITPLPVSTENIGQRTRSKFSLSETPLETIEQAFVPPDITTDMYDTVCDNQDWLNFLKDLVLPLDTSADGIELNDDENDPEYNVMVDEEMEDVDNEELRADRAVKVSKKELNSLMSELFEYTQMHEDCYNSDEEPCRAENEELKNLFTEQPVTESLPEQTPEEPQPSQVVLNEVVLNDEDVIPSPCPVPAAETQAPTITEEQYLLIKQQLMQHTQMLLQSYLLSCGSPFVSKVLLDSCKSDLLHLKNLGDASTFPDSIFRFPTLQFSIDLMSKYETFVGLHLNTLLKWNNSEASKGSNQKTRLIGCPRIHPFLMKLCLRSKAFQYPLLLPTNGFGKTKVAVRERFLDSENVLIALGLDHCYNDESIDIDAKAGLMKACDLIHSALIPVRSTEAIMKYVWNIKINNRFSPGMKGMVIKDFYTTRIAPPVNHFVVPIDSDNLLFLFQHERQLIDTSWHKSLYEEIENRKILAARKKRKAETVETINKIFEVVVEDQPVQIEYKVLKSECY